MGIRLATVGLIVAAGLAAAIRVWGTAYLGAATVNKHAMVSGLEVLADGPYRFVRNPLYWGTWLMSVAIAGLMPVSGAVVALVLLAFFLLRLILGEEAFLRAELGAPYEAYRRIVPRLFPLPGRYAAAQGRASHWGRAIVSEVLPLGVFVSFAALSWQFNAMLLAKAVLISFGVSLVVRAGLPMGPEQEEAR
jgi:protein-S-isoprenylcysteine O-methyltransferase Ste14